MARPPLLVHLVVHPHSDAARQLARHLHRELNDDVVVPGLRVPTVFCPEGDGAAPPAQLRLDAAERSFVVPLADHTLNNDDDWCGLVAETWEGCRGTQHRCVPIQLEPNAWPLDDRLRGVSFARAFAQPAGEARNAFVVRRLVIELCRYLLNWETDDPRSQAPVKLFLSHTKLDINDEPKVTQQLIAHLKQDEPVEAWVDSGSIPSGSEFAEAIEQGVERTSLLVVLTDQYATREWCRREVLLAKEHQRPIVVIDTLKDHEVRSFPYLGNVPVVHWNGDPHVGIDLLLKDTLRHLHAAAVLKRTSQPGDVVRLRPPELATLVGLPPGAAVLYPDPPVGAEEARLLARTNVTCTTPLERLAVDRRLPGKVIALSMSESTDVSRYGLDQLHLESTMLELSRYLLIKGATLAYGGHLGATGYTQRLFELVRAHNQRDQAQPFERIVNHRGWPLPRLSKDQRSELKPVAQTTELPRPADVDETLHADFTSSPAFFPGSRSPAHRFAWARGMTEMRRFQADQARSGVCARIVLGGTFGPTVKVAEDGTRSEQWYSSRIPGVLEEVLLSVQAGQPVFLIGAFGGAARLVIDLLEGRARPEATWAYQQRAPFAPEMKALYEQRGLEWWDYPDMVQFLRDKGLTGVNRLLTPDEHRELFETIDAVRMVEIVLGGVGEV